MALANVVEAWATVVDRTGCASWQLLDFVDACEADDATATVATLVTQLELSFGYTMTFGNPAAVTTGSHDTVLPVIDKTDYATPLQILEVYRSLEDELSTKTMTVCQTEITALLPVAVVRQAAQP